MARKPTLSPSKITTYLACPVKYRWTYVDDRGKWYLRAKTYYSFGSTLHRALERFHNAGDIGVETTDQVVAAYEESWIDAGFNSAEEMAEAYGEGKAILERHVENVGMRQSNARTLFVEKQLKFEYPEFTLVGRVDRIDEHPDGSLEIVDYKTGRASVDEEDVRSDIAMSVYQLQLRELYPDRPIRATICALRTGSEASYSMSSEELEEFKTDVHKLGLEILTQEFWDLVPLLRGLCEGCDFMPLCRKHPEFSEALVAVSG